MLLEPPQMLTRFADVFLCLKSSVDAVTMNVCGQRLFLISLFKPLCCFGSQTSLLLSSGCLRSMQGWLPLVTLSYSLRGETMLDGIVLLMPEISRGRPVEYL